MKILKKYNVEADNVPALVTIVRDPDEYVPIYTIHYPKIEEPTKAILDAVREKMIKTIKLKISEIVDPKAIESIKAKFKESAEKFIASEFPKTTENERKILTGYLVHEMLGLGELELIINDDELEEIVINSSDEPLWVFHKKLGWLKTNVKLKDEEQTYNYASIIGRKIGRQITNLNPLMDAHLPQGDRVNATLFPISTRGHTITIRKFRREPWTMVDLIDPKENTLSKEIAALLWLAMQYELNVLIAGGTASGKTSVLNALMPFIQANHRVISIEDTRELRLPDFLHWVPLTTRNPNPEGKGEVTMLDLLINSLRMRPDRLIVGEIRRAKEAEVLFEAMHTGHSVYSTLHADRAEQVIRRLTNPPIDLPITLLDSLHLVIVQFRHRKLRIRRTLEVAELISGESARGRGVARLDILYKWNPKDDNFVKVKESVRLIEEIRLHTGMSEEEMNKDLKEKGKILQWMLDNNIRSVNDVGKIVAYYYNRKEDLLKVIQKKGHISDILKGKERS